MSTQDMQDNGKPVFDTGLNDAMDRSDHELIHLANFYHERGYVLYAQEIYRAIFKMRTDRNNFTQEADEEERKDEAS